MPMNERPFLGHVSLHSLITDECSKIEIMTKRNETITLAPRGEIPQEGRIAVSSTVLPRINEKQNRKYTDAK